MAADSYELTVRSHSYPSAMKLQNPIRLELIEFVPFVVNLEILKSLNINSLNQQMK